MDPNLHSSMFSGDTSSAFDPMFSTISLQSLLFADVFPPLASLTDEHNLEENKLLLVPKPENPYNFPIDPPQHFNFFPYDHSSVAAFQRLPELHSPEQKRLRRVETVIPQSNLARQRRQKLSEKTRCLQKLMPWDKKMDQATLLEEAYKYVKFLQAQCSVLHSMPSQSHSGSGSAIGHNGVFGDLERLNRNQVLQVLVNSPVAQTRLYSQGFCVFSVEQLQLLKKLSDRRLHIADHAASSISFFN